jgi:hypothetical protein
LYYTKSKEKTVQNGNGKERDSKIEMKMETRMIRMRVVEGLYA